MTEDQAQAWLHEQFGPDRHQLLARLVDIVRAETLRQNLIAASTSETIWARHVVDSAQLVALASDVQGNWIDIGTGAGFPGIVVALLTDRVVTLVEPRKKRAEFLQRTVEALGIGDRVTVITCKAHNVVTKHAVISARAVSSIDALFASCITCSRSSTLWLMPKGQSALEEITIANQAWHAMFHVEQSITDLRSRIVIATKVTRR